MNHSEILSHVDHTLLAQTATWEEIRALCDDALRFGTASVCIPPCRVKQAKEYLGERMAVCTVIGFPNGYSTAAAKLAETKEALADGAEGNEQLVKDEIACLKEACKEKILKVIIETCLLTEEEKITMCRLVTEAGADYIKTSTGFSTAGATFQDVALFARHIGPHVKIKAAGGISSFEDAEEFLKLGADRLGTSRLVKIEKAAQKA